MKLLPAVPRSVVQRLSDRYIAGSTLDDARRTVVGLNAEGKTATVDVLGEEVTRPEEAVTIAGAYHAALDAIAGDHLDANVSVKLTALGLEVDLDLCRSLLATVVADAAARGTFVRIDMEQSACTDDTLRLYRELREAGRDNVGVVLQSCLRRSLADADALVDLRPNVRICKGIYLEPESIAYTDFEEIRASFVRSLEALVETASYVGIATHDAFLIAEGKRIARERYEFQMLLGVRESLGRELVRDGERLRIYVPFGRQWYEYSLRRLQENPRIAGYIATGTVGRLFSRNGS